MQCACRYHYCRNQFSRRRTASQCERAVRAEAKKSDTIKVSKYRPPTKEDASLRAEAEAPFRSLRIVLFGFGAVSAFTATLFSIPSIIGASLSAPGAKDLVEAFKDLGINIASVSVLGLLLKRDLDARERQMARLMREDALGACQLQLASGKMLRLAQLRGAVRPVIVAGTPEQVREALQAAEPYQTDLQSRGVLIIALVLDGDVNSLPEIDAEDLRYRATAVRLDDWRKWFTEQALAAGKSEERGLYVGLRKDGRVRASGIGCPPWATFVAQLPPTEGFFGGLFDGMDGRVL